MLHIKATPLLFSNIFSQVKGEFNLCADLVKTSMINDKIPLKSGYSLATGGWGSLVPTTGGIILPEFLQFTIQTFITLEECNKTVTELLKKYPEKVNDWEITLEEGQLCTIPTKHTETCKGDSGSGLIMAPVSFLIFQLIQKGIPVGLK